jgi:hypothetical protein
MTEIEQKPGSETTVDPEAIMEDVRARVRMKEIAGESGAYQDLYSLAEEIRQLREQLGRRLKNKDRLRLVGSPSKSIYENFEISNWTHEIPPTPTVHRIPPLNLLFRAGRKFLLKTQRIFNWAAVCIFRGVVHDLLQIERYQLNVLEELERIAEIERRLSALERRAEQSAERE